MAYEPTIKRATLLEGPAHIITDKSSDAADWKYLWCSGAVTVNLVPANKDVAVAGFGNIDSIKTDETIEVDFTPAGEISADILSFLYNSLLSAKIGSGLFGDTDTPVWVHSLDGKLLPLTCAKVTTLPTLMMGVPNQRFEGGAKLTGIIGDGLTRSTANALFTPISNLAFGRQPDPATWQHLPVKAVWSGLKSGSPASDIEIETEAGWKINLQVTLTARKAANIGTFNFRLDSVGLQASCKPLNLAEVELFGAKVIGSDRRIGTRLAGTTLTLTEDYPGVTTILNGAKLTTSPLVYDAGNPRAGECTWTAYRDFSTGTMTDPGSIAMTANPAT